MKTNNKQEVLAAIKKKAAQSTMNKNPHPMGSAEAKAWNSGVKKRTPING